MSDVLTVTTVGGGIYPAVALALENAGIISVNSIKEVNKGSLGNFTTLTVSVDIPEDEVIVKRRMFMDILLGQGLVPMYLHGDWMRVVVFPQGSFVK